MIELNDLLTKTGLNPEDVLVMRHTPTEKKLARVMPFLVSERPDLFNAYQCTQAPRTGNSMQRRDYLASFLGLESGRATFIGIYEIGDGNIAIPNDYWADPKNKELRDLGMNSENREVMVFDMKPTNLLKNLSGRLEIEWTKPNVSWYRLADTNILPVLAIHTEGIFDAGMPDWQDLILSWRELAVLPSSWKSALQQWRGVYLIFDESDGRGYVGSAYGTDNILGRWLGYAASGHGGNKRLKLRDPNNFRFSILQRVSPDMPSDEVIEIEASWKKRLHARDYGLNAN